MTNIVPFEQREQHPPEAGRIRIGVKTERAMKKIDTFRFTSPHKILIEAIAEQFGGTCQQWDDERAAMRNQWEVITTVSEMEVIVPQGGLSQWYEKWSGGGIERRCDGAECTVAGSGPNPEPQQVPCICRAQGTKECRPTTRYNIILPTIPFLGQWRHETKSEHAVHEIPGMYEMISHLTASNEPVRAMMTLQQRSKMVRGRRQHFAVIVLGILNTPEELLAGTGVVRPSLSGGTVAPGRALEAGTPVAAPTPSRAPDPDDEIVDAEIVEEPEQLDDRVLEARVRDMAKEYALDPDWLVTQLWSTTDSDLVKISSAVMKVRAGEFVPGSVNGVLKWGRR